MRILFVCRGFEKSSVIAQPWRHSYEIAKYLISEEHEIAIITDAPSTFSPKETTTCGISTYVLPKSRGLPFLFSILNPREVRNVIKKFSPTAIYWDGTPLIGNYIRRLKNIKIPLIVHISTSIYNFKELRFAINDFYWSPTYLLFLMMSNPLLSPFVLLLNQETINMITVPNLAIKNRLVQRGVTKSKIKVLPAFMSCPAGEMFFGRDMEAMTNVREELEVHTEDFLITYFGPPHTYRGTDTLIHAVAKLRSKLPKLKLLMLLRQGSEEEDYFERKLKQIAQRLELHNHVKFISRLLSEQDLKTFLQISDAIALPFKFIFNEPPLSILETMAMGKPLITTWVSGLPELIGNDRGVLVEPRNADRLADSIHYLVNNPEDANSLGKRAKEYVSKLPLWGDVSEYVLNLCNSIT